jgi:hypothetical protein
MWNAAPSFEMDVEAGARIPSMWSAAAKTGQNAWTEHWIAVPANENYLIVTALAGTAEFSSL